MKPYLTIFGLASTLLSPFPVTVGDSRIWRPGLWWHSLAFPIFLNFILACHLDHMTSPFKASVLRNVNTEWLETTLSSAELLDWYVMVSSHKYKTTLYLVLSWWSRVEIHLLIQGTLVLIPALGRFICWGAANPMIVVLKPAALSQCYSWARGATNTEAHVP